MLCHDSPMDSTESHQTLPAWSRERNGCRPATWQIELIDQVTWKKRPSRTIVAQKNAVSAPHQDIASSPPPSGGRSTDTATQAEYSRATRTVCRSASSA